jgi:(2R)-ethylmalonyl-CoA mutase
MGLPRPWDQQWSLRIQQVLANETDLLEYPDVFEGSVVMEGLVEELSAGALEEMKVVEERGGAIKAVPYMKSRLVESHRERVARIESGEQKVIGQNSFKESAESPLTAGADGGIMTPDPEVERELVAALEQWKADRDEAAVDAALAELAKVAADDGQNIMPATIAAAKAGATTGEWAQTMREVFGAYRGPTGVDGAAPPTSAAQLDPIRAKVDETSEQIGHRIKILVGKPGLDGHSNGAEQIALRARDVGMEVIYQGIRLTPEEIATSALQEDVDVVGLSILSGSHLELIPEVVRLLAEEGLEIPVVVGGIIPVADAKRLREAGVAGVYTPKDFDINSIMSEIVELVGNRHASRAAA